MNTDMCKFDHRKKMKAEPSRLIPKLRTFCDWTQSRRSHTNRLLRLERLFDHALDASVRTATSHFVCSRTRGYERHQTIGFGYLEPYRSPPSAAGNCASYRDCYECLIDLACAWCAVLDRCLARQSVADAKRPICRIPGVRKFLLLCLVGNRGRREDFSQGGH